MRHIKKLLAFIFIAMAFLIMWVELLKGQRKEPILISEKTFNERIMDAAFTEDGTPKVIVTEKSVKFLNADGSVKSERKETGMLFGKKGVVGILRDAGRDKCLVTVFNSEGDSLWQKMIGFEGGYIVLSDDGNSMLYRECSSCFVKLSIKGKESKELESYEEPPSIFEADFSDDGQYFVISAQKSGGWNVFFFNINKPDKAVWEYKVNLPGTIPSCTKISPDGNFIIATAFYIHAPKIGSCYCFNKNGDLLWKFDDNEKGVGAADIAFSPDNKYCTFISSIKRLFFIDMLTGKAIWSYTEDKTNDREFLSSAISFNESYTFVNLTTYYNPKKYGYEKFSNQGPRYVYVFSPNGEKIWEKAFDGSSYEDWRRGPIINFGYKNKSFSIINGGKIHNYHIP